MDFSVSSDQQALYEAYAEFGSGALVDGLEQMERDGDVDGPGWRDRWSLLAERGTLGLPVSTSLGGSGLGLITTAMALQGLGFGCAYGGLLLGVNATLWTVIQPLIEFGSDAQRDRWLPGLLNGSIIAADGVTEEKSGSDAMTLTTTAEWDGEAYVLNGEKIYVGLAPLCDLALVYAATKPTAGVWGNSVFLVDMSLPGVSRGPTLNKAGFRSLPTGSLKFEEVRLSEDSRLGQEGSGSSIFARASEWERQMIFVSHVGSMKRQLDRAIEHGATRESKGQPIDQYQSVSNRLADMRLRYETTWLMQMRAAWQLETGHSNGSLAALTKLHVSEALLANSLDAARVFGGQGFEFDSDIARDLRDALGGVTLGGTSDIQRQLIAQIQSRERR